MKKSVGLAPSVVPGAVSARLRKLAISRPSLAFLLVIVCGAIMVVLHFWWLASHDSAMQFLPHRQPAEWILYPSPPAAGTHPMVELDTKFRHEFFLKEASSNAILSLCAFKRCSVIINDVPVLLPEVPQGHWKELLSVRASMLRRQGLNRIEVVVSNDSGPPALWLSLQGDGVSIVTDASWDVSYAGATWQSARLADAPVRFTSGSPFYGGEEVLAAWSAEWRNLLVFGLLCAGLWVGGSWWFKGRQISAGPRVRSVLATDPAAACLAGIVVIWMALITHNAGLLPRMIGYDTNAHLDYIKYVQQHWKLPLADQGAEMYNPPLYYVMAAAVLQVFGLTTGTSTGIMVLRYLALVMGIVHLLLVSGSLRLLFPGQSAKQIIGLLIAGFFPAHLFLSHYVTNEVLLSVLVSGTVYLALRALRDERPSPTRLAGVGAMMGLALLTKFTAVMVVPFVIGAVSLRLFQKGARDCRTWFRTVGLMTLTCLMLCGWHYTRVWMHFGKPFVGGWEVISGRHWWQDPGYRTSAYMLRFGESLSRPLFSGLTGLADGVFSSLWGDGYCGGVAEMADRTPWNYYSMAAGYPLALVPVLLILAGAIVSLGRLIRKPSPEGVLVNGPAWAFALALIYIVLTKLPCYSLVKGFYGLFILSPVCIFAAIGWEFCTRRIRVVRVVLGFVLGVWALNGISTYWVHQDSAPTQFLLGRELAAAGQHEKAITAFSAALAANPDFTRAKCWLADSLEALGQQPAADSLNGRVFDEHPRSPENQLDLAFTYATLASRLEQQGRLEEAAERARRAIEAAPEHPLGYRRLASQLLRLGRAAEAIQVCRAGLRISPAHPEIHFSLGTALMLQQTASDSARGHDVPPPVAGAFKLDDPVQESISHLYLAIELSPKAVPTLAKLARILATDPDPRYRNGNDAVRFAERACQLTDYRQPELVGTLALAYAEAGRFPDAIAAAQQAQMLSGRLGQERLVEVNQEWLDLFRAGRVYREPREFAGIKAIP